MRSRIARLVVFVSLALSAGACHRPASIAFSPAAAVVIEDDKGAKLPPVVALDSDGKQLEKAPEVVFSSDPLGVVTLENGTILPNKNGDTTVRATAENLPPAELKVKVAVIDDVRVTCPPPCTLHVGENAMLDTVATGLGDKITKGISLTSSDPAKATVDATGKLTGVSAGTVVITAKLGKKATDTKIEIHPAVDELRILCPWPPLAVIMKKGVPPPASERSCEVMENQDMKVDVIALSKGEVVLGERVEWRSSDPSVRVAGSTVTGDHVGGSMVEAHVGDIVAEMPVSVISAGTHGLGSGHCSAEEAAYSSRFEIALTLKSGAIDTALGAPAQSQEKLDYRCETTAAKRCLDDAAREISHVVEKLPFDANGASAFGTTSLDERARRCCCKR